jgi:hypothetical protein
MQHLYSAAAAGVGSGRYIHGAAWEVWQPHFEPLLIDCLATDVFDQLGRMTTLEDFADALIATQSSGSTANTYFAPIASLLLAGERNRAAEYVEKLETKDLDKGFKQLIRTHWQDATSDIETFCAKMHAEEAAAIKAMKLDAIWEPSPFPVELPPAERRARSAEPVFMTTPWLPPPSWLWQELPTVPGEIRFAKDFSRRNGRLILPVALTRGDAEVRHHAGENYVLVARLPDGLVLMIRQCGWDRNDPWYVDRAPTGKQMLSLLIELHGESRLVHASTSFDRDGTGDVKINSIAVHERLTHKSFWSCSFDREEDVKRIWDSRSGQRVFTKSQVTVEERELVACQIPPFGEYALVADRLRALLQLLNYGGMS